MSINSSSIWNPHLNEKKILLLNKSFLNCPSTGAPSLIKVIRPFRQQEKLPAFSIAILSNKKIESVAAVGVTKEGTDIPVSFKYRWFLGSCTKPITATLTALLIEQGKLEWKTTIGDIFPEYMHLFTSTFKCIKVIDLLSHRSGLPRNQYPDFSKWFNYDGKGSVVLQRLHFLTDISKTSLLFNPGEQWLYSNVGYIVLGAIIDKILNMSF